MILRKDLKIGDKVYFFYKKKVFDGKVEKLNPKYARVKTGNRVGFMVRYNALYWRPELLFASNDDFMEHLKENKEDFTLDQLLSDVVHEYDFIFKSHFTRRDLDTIKLVKIRWGNRLTYRQAGKYIRRENTIVISKSLSFCPGFVVKKVIYHELLHVHFLHHDPLFKKLERKYRYFIEANEMIENLFQHLRISKDLK
ncbi:MAG: hypothetical protein ACTSVI_13870 [Promethearchaeota archaeon]